MEKSKKSINVEGGFLFCGGWNFSKSVSVGPTFIREMRVHITGTRATISMLIKQGKKYNQNRRKLYSVNSFPVMTTGISLCSNSTL